MIFPQYIRIIISQDEVLCSQIIKQFEETGIYNYFVISDYNKQALLQKMQPRTVERFDLEVSLADHCNLNCQCCDHFAPIAEKTFLDYEQYVKDINRISKLTGGYLGSITLLGGEPLLNERLIDCMSITRDCFPESAICIFTDGLLLRKRGLFDDDRNIWQAIYKVNSFEEITERLTHRTSFCNYCAVDKRYQRPWKQSDHSMEEWTL